MYHFEVATTHFKGALDMLVPFLFFVLLDLLNYYLINFEKIQ